VSIVEEYDKQYLLGPRGLKKTSELASTCLNRFLERNRVQISSTMVESCKVPPYLEYSEMKVVHFVGA
jgi:hypothetical protein